MLTWVCLRDRRMLMWVCVCDRAPFSQPPAFSQSLSFNLVPIKTGEVHLPSPKLLCVTTGAEVIDPAAKHRVFVRPSELVANWANVPTHPNTVGARQVA
jgi:hypothetical protein